MVNQQGKLDRRTVLGGIAVGGVAVPLLAACGGSTSAKPTAKAGEVLAKTSDVPVGGGTILKSANVVVTQPTSGQFKCFSAICTHEGCTVGQISNGSIVCPCHGSQFSIKDGSNTVGPNGSAAGSTPALPEEKITVSGGEIRLS